MQRVLTIAAMALCAAIVAVPASASLITNGNFESGNVGFSSDYEFKPFTTASRDIGLGTYSVGNNPKIVHSSWYVMGDHTTGSGNMMIVNGSSDPTKVVWSQNVTLTAGVTYEFVAWGSSIYPTAPGKLRFAISGSDLGDLQLTSTVPDWKKFSATYTATTSGPLQLTAIRDLTTDFSGNDFALDDISLTAVVPEPMSLAVWSVLGVAGIGLKRWTQRRKK